jgi:hypothetical protein
MSTHGQAIIVCFNALSIGIISIIVLVIQLVFEIRLMHSTLFENLSAVAYITDWLVVLI